MHFFLFLLGAEILCVGLFSGLLFTLISIVHPMLSTLSAAEGSLFMQRFIKFAHKNPFFTVLTFFSVLLPLILLVLAPFQREFSGGIAALIFILIGWLLFLTGVIILTQRSNAPLYESISRWNSEDPAPDWQQAQREWHRLNRIRASAAGVALLLFLIALLLAS